MSVGLAPQAVGAEAAVDPSDAALVGSTPRHDDQIVRLYMTILGRTPDAGGAAYWTQRRLDGESLTQIARVMLSTPEPQQVSSGDFIVDAYRNALGRDPDAGGHAYWTAMNDPARAIAYISDSPEHRSITGTLAPPAVVPVIAAPTVNQPAVFEGWVDAGHGVLVPPILLEIRWCESRGDYRAANRTSSARGAYQFLRSSWAAYGHATRYGVSTADQATPPQQDEAALITWQRSGTRPWLASSHCWG